MMYISFCIVLALLVASTKAGYVDECSGYTSCQQCVSNSYCGWCSPKPIEYANGTVGTQCGDQRDAPWHCDHQYQTDKCVQGYVCNQTVGQCQLAAPGKGDTKENCEKTCKVDKLFRCTWETSKPQCVECDPSKDTGCTKYNTDCSACTTPPPLYQCNTGTHQCEACKNAYCTKDSDCPGSYCQISGFGPWTCHGSKCGQKGQCEQSCNSTLPEELLGVWRGVQIQHGYDKGEWDFRFQNADPRFSAEDAAGNKKDGKITASALTHEISITFTDGSSWQGIYKAWEQSPETEDFAFAFSTSSKTSAPASIPSAMNGGDYRVFSMSKCLKNKPNCTFASIFADKMKVLKAKLSPEVVSIAENVVDHCNVHDSCATCIGDGTKLCGWCDEPVEYVNGGVTGAHCAGFDANGTANPAWICKSKYRREQCFDYKCDWTDLKHPVCKQMPSGQGGVTKMQCDGGCKPPSDLYKCSNTTFKCEACGIKYCSSDKDCPGSYCQISNTSVGPFTCHGSVPEGCNELTSCNASCGFHLTGTWRGINIANGFQRGEWDVSFYSDGTAAWKVPESDEVITTAIAISDRKVTQPSAVAITFKVTSTGAHSGEEWDGLYIEDDKGNDSIVKMLMLGSVEDGEPETFDQTMQKNNLNLFLTACAKGSNCDFSASNVPK